MENKILLITEDTRTKYYLERVVENQAEIYPAKDIQHGLAHLTRYSYQLVAIGNLESVDIVCRVIRIIQDISDVYILCIGIDDLAVKQKLIETGADATLSIDCDIAEARLQIYSLLRRTMKQELQLHHEVVHVGNLRMDYYHRKVYWKSEEIQLTKKEYDFLYLIAAAPGRVYTFDQIHQIIWQEHAHGDVKNIVWCMVSRLKKKLRNIDTHAPKLIHNIRDVGYYAKLNDDT